MFGHIIPAVNVPLIPCSQTSDYVLQVSGERSYIAGQNELLSFKDIRRCIIKEEPIHLSISHHPNPDKDLPIGIHVCLVDPLVVIKYKVSSFHELLLTCVSMYWRILLWRCSQF